MPFGLSLYPSQCRRTVDAHLNFWIFKIDSQEVWWCCSSSNDKTSLIVLYQWNLYVGYRLAGSSVFHLLVLGSRLREQPPPQMLVLTIVKEGGSWVSHIWNDMSFPLPTCWPALFIWPFFMGDTPKFYLDMSSSWKSGGSGWCTAVPVSDGNAPHQVWMWLILLQNSMN